MTVADPADPANPLEIVGRLVSALEVYGVRDVTVTGSAALGVWATPRQSRDLDLCAAVPPGSVPRILARFDGIAAGPPDNPEVMRLRFLDWDIDVFVNGDTPYDRECTSRAAEIQTTAGSIRVVSAEDLLIHKLIKLRSDRRRILQDLADMRALAEARAGTLDWAYLRRWLPEPDAKLLETLSALDDDAIVRKILTLG